MTTFAPDSWTPVLSRLNAVLLRWDEFENDLTQLALSTGWCGSSPAFENEILESEMRLGLALPPSYRSFLSISNGWSPFSTFVKRLLPVQEIERFGIAKPDRLAAILDWQEDDISDSDYLDYENPRHRQAIRPRYYADSILASEGWGGGELVLLNPNIITADGEWETIFFANWIPGNRRYRTFLEFAKYGVGSLESLEAS